MFYRLSLALILLSAAAASAAAATPAAGDEVPAWLKQAAAATPPSYDRKVPAVVLHREQQIAVAADGRVVTTTTYAVRVLTREGRATARASEIYLTGSGRVRELRAWLLRPSGQVKRYGKDETVDVALAEDDVYNEVRARVIDAEDDVDGPGSVFGYQAVSEERTVFTQNDWVFQSALPSLVSRFTLSLPAGWKAEGVVFNHPPLAPSVAGSSYTWELRNLPPIEPEPHSPQISSLVPRVAVSFFPADGARGALGPGFGSWAEVSRWMTTLHDPQSEPDERVAAKARELTSGARTELEKIRAIGRYVQNIQYISIQIGLNRGGGYRPHSATEVFAKGYGDCKDKANLMRAMLKAVGLKGYSVLIYSGDRAYVREEWPSPQQFNHCIIAVRVGDETKAPAIITHPTLGRLLVFDATDDNTPVGDLPDHEQGSLALVVAGDEGALLRMPVTAPEENLWRREVEAGLAADGSLTATVRERLAGSSAVSARRAFKGLAKADYERAVERWVVGGTATGAKFVRIEPSDDHGAGRFALDVEFRAEGFAQNMQGRLLVFKPAVVSRGRRLRLGEPTRKHPLVIEAESFTETVRVRLPEGFEVDELPEGFKLDSEFGTFTAAYEIKEGHLIFSRTLVQRAATVPASRYKEARDFFGRVHASEDSPVVLARK